jgi:hypothetical protein
LEFFRRQKCRRKKKEKQNLPYSYIWFSFVCDIAKNIEGRLKICTLFLVNSHIWLNLDRDDCHCFFLQLPMDDRHFVGAATNKKIRKENTQVPPTVVVDPGPGPGDLVIKLEPRKTR